MKDSITTLIGIIALSAILVILTPVVIFLLGYFSGWLAKIMIGDKICKAFLIAFSISIEPSMLPWIGGALAWIGSFFKSINLTGVQKGGK